MELINSKLFFIAYLKIKVRATIIIKNYHHNDLITILNIHDSY